MRPNEPTVEEFGWQMELISRYMTPLSLSEAMDCMRKERLPKGAICVTFDDGYADNLTLAAPILQQRGIPATVYVASDFLNGGIMWNDAIIESIKNTSQTSLDLTEQSLGIFGLSSKSERYHSAMRLIRQVKNLNPEVRDRLVSVVVNQLGCCPDDLMLTDTQLLALSQKFAIDIGGHTCAHPILTSIDKDSAGSEIIKNKEYLEGVINKKVRHFAYPNGRYRQDYNDVHVSIVKEFGFESAVSTDIGCSSATDERYRLKRFTPWDRSRIKFYLRLLLNAM